MFTLLILVNCLTANLCSHLGPFSHFVQFVRASACNSMCHLSSKVSCFNRLLSMIVSHTLFLLIGTTSTNIITNSTLYIGTSPVRSNQYRLCCRSSCCSSGLIKFENFPKSFFLKNVYNFMLKDWQRIKLTYERKFIRNSSLMDLRGIIKTNDGPFDNLVVSLNFVY
jgi:hypothetical protein